MSFWSRIRNVLHTSRVNRDLDDELNSHLDEAVRMGRSAAEARRAFGSPLLHRERSRDITILPWLDSLRADTIFGFRQLAKNKVTSAAAILSLAVAIGACTSAFRLIDAMLLRPLPVASPERLYVVARQGLGPAGDMRISESNEYPLFQRMRTGVKDSAELIAVSYHDRVDLTFGSDDEMEKVQRQYVSGWMFGTFGLHPAVGRVLTENDDKTPGAHPYAVLSYDFWTRRFGKDPRVVGRSFRMDNRAYEIVGVASEGFSGTEPGTMIDVFVPTMMNPYVGRSDASWFRTLAVMKPGAAIEPVRAQLDALLHTFQAERASGWKGQTQRFIENFLNQTAILSPAPSGTSDMQKSYRLSLTVLGALVALVLLIACANVANLMTAQAAARSREMALRVSIGAGRGRLLQLVLVESAVMAFLAAAIGSLFAAWAAPFVVSMINPPDNPARLSLPTDWRLVAFGLLLSLTVTFLFGLAPALRASAIKPAGALRGGEDPHSRGRLMRWLIAAQVAFCFLVLFAAGLLASTFQRLSTQSTGFSSERLLTLETTAAQPQPIEFWDQAIQHLRNTPGIESAALAGWPLLRGTGWNGFIWVDGKPTEVLAYFLSVSPGWVETMGVRLLDGRDLRNTEATPGAALVNEAFVQQCFHGRNPIGQWFEKESGDGVTRIRFQVLGVVQNARYRNMREPITPTAYVPFRAVDSKGALSPRSSGTFIVRTANANPMAMASFLRKEIPRARPEFRVSTIRTQVDLNQSHTVRERLLAMLGSFFAGIALLLAGIGLYGVLNYSVVQRRREIGIRMAIGARAAGIVRLVTRDIAAIVALGAILGLALGIASIRYIESLLYHVNATDIVNLALPGGVILAAALVAAIPPVVRAIRIDPAQALRSE